MRVVFLAMALAVLAGCGQMQLVPPQAKGASVGEAKVPPRVDIMARERVRRRPLSDIVAGPKKERPDAYVGTWFREALYVNGKLQNGDPSALELSKTSYTSSGACTVTGELKVDHNLMTMGVASDNCPGAIVSNATYMYEVSDDGRYLTLKVNTGTQEVKEIYKRSK